MDHQSEYLTAAGVRARYGGIAKMTLYRWMADDKLQFPKPEPIRGRNYWPVDKLDAWDRRRVSGQTDQKPHGAKLLHPAAETQTAMTQ